LRGARGVEVVLRHIELEKMRKSREAVPERPL
jgi:hypothetical protein